MRWLVPPLLVAACLFLWPVDWSLWTDEFFMAAQAGRPFADLLEVAAHDRHPPLYFFVAALAGGLADTDAVIRLPSGLAALGAVAVTGLAARELAGKRAGGVAAAWLATSPVVFVFAHTARMYALVLFWGALLLLGSVRVAAGRRGGGWLLAAAGAAALYTHYAAIVPVLGALLAAALGRLQSDPAEPVGGRLRGLLTVAGASVFIGAAFLPWALGPLTAQLAEEAAPGARTAWVLGWLVFSPDEAWRPPTLLLAGLGLVAAGALVRERAGFALGWLVAAGVGSWLLSAELPARLPRNYLALLPFFVLAGSWALGRVGEHLRAPAWAVALVPVALQAPVLWELTRMPYHPQDVGGGHDYRVEAALLDRLIPVNDTVRFQPAYVVGQFARYAPGLKLRVGGGGPTWSLKASGSLSQPCALEHAFRVRVDPPAERCAEVAAFLDAAARDTDYPPLHFQQAVRLFGAGDHAAAAVELDRAALDTPRHPGVAELRAKIATAAGDEAAAAAAWAEALRIARAYDFPGKRVAGLWRQRARAARKAGDEAGATAATEAATCAQTRAPAWACGGPLAGFTEPLAAAAEPE